MSFRLTEGRGAALVTNYPTYREDIRQAGTFEKYTKEHHASWVAFARETGHGDVNPILVTGVDRTRDFALLCYSTNRDDLRCEFKRPAPGVASGQGTWRKSGSIYTNHGPQLRRPPSSSPSSNDRTERPSDEDEYNQCIFVRYFTVRKKFGIVRVIKAAAGPHDPGKRGRDGERSPLQARYDSGSDPDGVSSFSNNEDGWSPATSVDSESNVLIHNPTGVRYSLFLLPTVPDPFNLLQGGRDDFDVIAVQASLGRESRRVRTSLILQS